MGGVSHCEKVTEPLWFEHKCHTITVILQSGTDPDIWATHPEKD